MKLFNRLRRKIMPTDEQIIRDYAAFVERHGPSPVRIEDTSVLPHSKDLILSAMLRSLVPEADNMNEFLKTEAVFLAQFQPGVGVEPLYQGGFDLFAFIQQGSAE